MSLHRSDVPLGLFFSRTCFVSAHKVNIICRSPYVSHEYSVIIIYVTFALTTASIKNLKTQIDSLAAPASEIYQLLASWLTLQLVRPAAWKSWSRYIIAEVKKPFSFLTSPAS